MSEKWFRWVVTINLLIITVVVCHIVFSRINDDTTIMITGTTYHGTISRSSPYDTRYATPCNLFWNGPNGHSTSHLTDGHYDLDFEGLRYIHSQCYEGT
jgi:hypothetical protein